MCSHHNAQLWIYLFKVVVSNFAYNFPSFNSLYANICSICLQVVLIDCMILTFLWLHLNNEELMVLSPNVLPVVWVCGSRGCQVWGESRWQLCLFRWVLAFVWVLGIKSRSSGRTSSDLNCHFFWTSLKDRREICGRSRAVSLVTKQLWFILSFFFFFLIFNDNCQMPILVRTTFTD